MALKIKKVNSLEWIAEPLLDRPDLLRRKMFGLDAFYLGELLVLVLGDGEEPWNGILLPVERERQAELIAEHPEFGPHPILSKWLYVSQSSAGFESLGEWAIARMLRGDPRFGTVPKRKNIRSMPSRDKRGRPVPIRQGKSLGPKSEAELVSVGIRSLEQLRKLGWKTALEKLARAYPDRINLNMAYGLLAAVTDQDWRELSDREREQARRETDRLREARNRMPRRKR